MEITDVRVYPVQDEKVQAFVSIVFDRCFMVNDIKVIRGKDGLFVSMPSRKRRNGDFKDVAHPLNTETRRWIEERILGHYRALTDGQALPTSDSAGSPKSSIPVPATAPNGETGAQQEALAAVEAHPAEPSGSPTLEELERRHQGDSFWGVG